MDAALSVLGFSYLFSLHGKDKGLLRYNFEKTIFVHVSKARNFDLKYYVKNVGFEFSLAHLF